MKALTPGQIITRLRALRVCATEDSVLALVVDQRGEHIYLDRWPPTARIIAITTWPHRDDLERLAGIARRVHLFRTDGLAGACGAWQGTFTSEHTKVTCVSCLHDHERGLAPHESDKS